MTIRNPRRSNTLLENSLEMVGFLYKLGGGYLDDVATILYIGLLSVEGDEHKHQVRFFFRDLFAKCCLILQLAEDFGQ